MKTKTDALRNIVVAHDKPNNSEAKTKRVVDGLLFLGFKGQDLSDALKMLGWPEGDVAQSRGGKS